MTLSRTLVFAALTSLFGCAATSQQSSIQNDRAQPGEIFAEIQPKPAFCARSTANWSGYTTSWEIREGKLYFTDLEGTVCRRSPDHTAQLTSGCAIGHEGQCNVAGITLADICDVPIGGAHATWFSGELRIPDGELVTYVHAGWASEYERDLILDVKSGVVVGEKVVHIKANAQPAAEGLWKRLLHALRAN